MWAPLLTLRKYCESSPIYGVFSAVYLRLNFHDESFQMLVVVLGDTFERYVHISQWR